MNKRAAIAIVATLALSCGGKSAKQPEKPSLLSQVGGFLFRTFTLAVCREVEDRYAPDAGTDAE